ncbi:MAG: DUF4154 domain-containing protein [Ignavibacteriales bacterium]|nr:DUF4154 domain-containing protein [Ignavibacteriales bacterium]
MKRQHTSVFRSLAFRQRMIYVKLSLMMLWILPYNTAAQDVSVDIPTQITIFKTLLTFERTQRTDSTGALRVAVVYQSKFRTSLITRDEVAAHLLNDNGVHSQIIDIDLDVVVPMEKISGKYVSVVLVCPLRSFSIRAVTDLSRKHGILTMTVVPEYVSKGIAIGIDIKEAKPQILLNRAAAKMENADFDSRLFKFVKFIDTAE